MCLFLLFAAEGDSEHKDDDNDTTCDHEDGIEVHAAFLNGWVDDGTVIRCRHGTRDGTGNSGSWHCARDGLGIGSGDGGSWHCAWNCLGISSGDCGSWNCARGCLGISSGDCLGGDSGRGLWIGAWSSRVYSSWSGTRGSASAGHLEGTGYGVIGTTCGGDSWGAWSTWGTSRTCGLGCGFGLIFVVFGDEGLAIFLDFLRILHGDSRRDEALGGIESGVAFLEFVVVVMTDGDVDLVVDGRDGRDIGFFMLRAFRGG